MAEEAQIQLGVNVDDAGVEAELRRIFEQAFAQAGQAAAGPISQMINKLTQGTKTAMRGFEDLGDAGKTTLRGLDTAAGNFDKTAEGLASSLRSAGSALKPGTFDATRQTFNSLSEMIQRIQREIKELGASGANTEVNKNLTAALRSAANQANVVQQSIARETAISARSRAEAERIAQQDATRLAIAGSKERSVIAQQEGSQTLAAIRRSSAQRVEVIRGITTALKGMQDIFGRVVSGGSSVLGRSITGITSTLSSVGNALRRTNTDMTQGLNAAVDKRTAIIREGFTRQSAIISETTTRSIRNMEKLNVAASSGLTGLATGRSNVANALGIGGIVGGGFLVFNQLKEGIKGAQDFQQTMAVLQQQLGLTDAQMQKVHDTSIALGNALDLPGVSAVDAGDAINILTRQFGSLGTGAVDAAQSAAKGTLQLARAAKTGADEAASVIGAAVNVFGISADEATSVADKITGALAKAAGVSFTDFKEAFVQGATVFQNFVGPAESANDVLLDFNTSLATLAKSGIVGEQAGAGLKQFFIAVAGKQSDKALAAQRELVKRAGETGTIFFDSAGKARTFSDSIGVLRKSLVGMTDEQRTATLTSLFGARAQTIASALVATSAEDWDALRASMEQQGLAAKVAAAQNQGLRGAMDALGSVIDTQILLAFEQVDEVLGNLVLGFADLFNKLASGEGVFSVIRDALKGVAVALGALLAVKAGVEVIQLLGVAFSALLTPVGLLIGGLTLVGAAVGALSNDEFVSMLDNLGETQLGFEGLGGTLVQIRDNVVEFAQNGLGFLRDILVDDVLPAVKRGAEIIGTNLVAAFDVVSNFMRQTAIPAFKEFSSFLLDTVVPAVTDGLSSAFDAAADAISSFWGIVQPVLQPAIDGIGSLVSAIGDLASTNLLGALGGLGAVLAGGLGGFALGGPIGGAIGALGAGAAVLFATGLKDNLGDAISGIGETIGTAIGNLGGVISEAFSNLISSIDFGAIVSGAFEASGFARDIGQKLGNILSSPQLIAGLAGLGVLAATFAGQFLIGFGQGILDNVPELASLIGDALKLALKEGLGFALDNPALLIGGIAAFFAGRAFLGLFKTAGTQAGTELRTGLLASFRQNAFGGAFAGSGTSGSGFIRTLLFGDRGSQQATAALEVEAKAAAQRTVNAMRTTLQAAGRTVAPFAGADAIRKQFDELTAEIGPSGVRALRLRTAFTSGIRAVVDSVHTVSLQPIRNFFENMGVTATQALVTAGKGIATAAAGAFAGFQTGQSLAGQSGLTQALGVGGLALTLGAINPLLGAAAGAAGLVGIAFGNMGRKAEVAAAEVDSLTEALAKNKDSADQLADVGKILQSALLDAFDTGDLNAILDTGFNLDEFTSNITKGTADARQVFRQFIDNLGPESDRFALSLDFSQSFERLQQDIASAGLSSRALREEWQAQGLDADDLNHFLGFLVDSIDRYGTAAERAALQKRLSSQFDAQKTAAEDAGRSVDSYGAALQRINENAESSATVDGVNEALLRIPGAADAAKRALENFLAGPTAGGGPLQAQLDNFVLELPNLQTKIDQINAPDIQPLLQTALSNQLGNDIQTDLRGRVSVAITSGQVVPTLEGVQGFLQLLREQVQTGLDQGVISADVAAAYTIQIDSLAQDPELASKLATFLATQQALQMTVPVAPTAEVSAEDAAAFQDSILSSVKNIFGGGGGPQGFGGGFGMATRGGNFGQTVTVPLTLDPEITVQTSKASDAGVQLITAFVQAIVAGGIAAGLAAIAVANLAASSLAVGVPAAGGAGASTASAFARGIAGGAGQAVAAARALGAAAGSAVAVSTKGAFDAGIALAQGLAAGVRAATGQAVAAARSMALQVEAAAKNALGIASPSKVFAEIGQQIGAGLSQGIADSEDGILDSIDSVFDAVTRRATDRIDTIVAAQAKLFELLTPTSQGVGSVSATNFIAARTALASISTDLKSQLDQSAIDLWNAVVHVNEGQASAAEQAIAQQFNEFVNNRGGSGSIFDQDLIQGATNTQAFVTAGEKIREFIQVAVGSGQDLGSVVNIAQQYRNALIDTAAAYGSNMNQINALIGSLGLTDDQLVNFINQANALQAAAQTASQPTPKEDKAAADAEVARKDAEIAALKEALRLAAIEGGGFNVNVYPPFGDPEAIGLGTANRVATLLAG